MKALTYSGPHDGGDVWKLYRESATRFFEECGLNVSSYFSDCSKIAEVSDPLVVFYYALAHGGYDSFVCQLGRSCSVNEVREYLANRGRMGFAFCGHCWSHVKTGPATFSWTFRKGQVENTVTVGYYKAEQHLDGWRVSLLWQERFFSYLRQGMTFKESFDEAIADYPQIKDMVRMAGDGNLTLEAAKQLREAEIEQGRGCLTKFLPWR